MNYAALVADGIQELAVRHELTGDLEGVPKTASK
jgi:hypothetical protein